MSIALDPKRLYYSIGEVSEIIGVEPSTLRYWEKEFPQLHPKRTQRGRRQYTHEDIELLRQIFHLVRLEGISLENAKKRLGNLSKSENARIEAIARLIKIRNTLNQLKDSL